jgi:hypothetical protein
VNAIGRAQAMRPYQWHSGISMWDWKSLTRFALEQPGFAAKIGSTLVIF